MSRLTKHPIENSANNSGEKYESNQNHCSYRHSLCCRVTYKRGYDSRWNDSGGNDRQSYYLARCRGQQLRGEDCPARFGEGYRDVESRNKSMREDSLFQT